MNFKRFNTLAIASWIMLPLAATDALAAGMTNGKSCGYSGWQHPHGYGMGHWRPTHGYGYGHGKAHGYSMRRGMPHHGHGYHERIDQPKGMYGHHPMVKMGGYGFSQPSASGYGMGREDKSAASEKDIVDTAVSAGNFTTLIEAVKAAGLAETLRGQGPFTVFAPSDEAFAKLPPETLSALLQDAEKLTAILTYHVAPGSLRAADVVNRGSIETVQGESVTVMASDDGVSVDEATVTKTDILASNGVIHVIDTVVLPN